MGESNPIAEAKPRKGYTTVTVKQPKPKYLDKFINLDCAIDILKLDLFPNAKEISETYAAYRAVLNYQDEAELEWDNRDNVAISVGDGARPRTAAFFAFMTKWECHSVDPQLNDDMNYDEVRRLHLHKKRIQDVQFDVDTAIILAVHSHAELQGSIDSINANKYIVVALPCCRELKLNDKEPNRTYADWGCFSPHRQVKVWWWNE